MTPVLAWSGTWESECMHRPIFLHAACDSKPAFHTTRKQLRAPFVGNLSWMTLNTPGNLSCAVVGTSGMLLTQKHGDWIDKHDIVLRINFAPLHSFERHVGMHTTARVMQMETFSNDPQYQAVLRKETRDYGGVPRIVSCHPPFDGRCTKRRFAQVFNRVSPGTAHLMSTYVARSAARRFRNSRQRSVTTGMLAIEASLAAPQCRRIRVFGFADGRCSSACYHYYQMPCVHTEGHFFNSSLVATAGYHNFAAQAEVLAALNQSGRIEWILDACIPSHT